MDEVLMSAYGWLQPIGQQAGIVFGGSDGNARLVTLVGDARSLNAIQIQKETEIGVFNKLAEFKTESQENQVTLISYVYKLLGAGESKGAFIEKIQRSMFSYTESVNIGLDGPILVYGSLKLQLNHQGALEILDGGTPIVTDNKSIYTVISNVTDPYSLGVEYIRSFLIRVTNKDIFVDLLTREDLIYRYVDSLMLITKDSGDAAMEQIFEEKIVGNNKSTEVKVEFKNGKIYVNNNGTIFVVDGGDGLGFSIDGNVINMTTGLKKSMNKAHTTKAAAEVVGTHVGKLFTDCGKKAKEIYVTRIVPSMDKFTNYIASGDYEPDMSNIQSQQPPMQDRQYEQNRGRAREQDLARKRREQGGSFRDRQSYQDDYYDPRSNYNMGITNPWLTKGCLLLAIIVFVLLFMAAC